MDGTAAAAAAVLVVIVDYVEAHGDGDGADDSGGNDDVDTHDCCRQGRS